MTDAATIAGRPLHPSPEAMRVHAALIALGATSAAHAVTDRRIAEEAGIAERHVIDLAAELVDADIAVLAGTQGRWISESEAEIEDYVERLRDRAAALHGREGAFRRLLERKRLRKESLAGGQAMLQFAGATG